MSIPHPIAVVSNRTSRMGGFCQTGQVCLLGWVVFTGAVLGWGCGGEENRAGPATPSDPASSALSGSTLDRVFSSGMLRVGLTGDYRPFSWKTGAGYEGEDVRVVNEFVRDVGLKLQFVDTTWPTLVDDMVAGRFDMAVGGITRTLERSRRVAFSIPVKRVGKCPLVRTGDEEKYATIEQINQPEVRVGANPGGTNNAFAKERLGNAQFVLIPHNQDLPLRILDRTVDVVVSDNVEAIRLAEEYEGLSAVNPDKPFTRQDLGYMLPRGDVPWKAYVDLWIERRRSKE